MQDIISTSHLDMVREGDDLFIERIALDVEENALVLVRHVLELEDPFVFLHATIANRLAPGLDAFDHVMFGEHQNPFFEQQVLGFEKAAGYLEQLAGYLTPVDGNVKQLAGCPKQVAG